MSQGGDELNQKVYNNAQTLFSVFQDMEPRGRARRFDNRKKDHVIQGR